MKNVLKKIKFIPIIVLILITMFCFSGCYSGIVSEEQYKELFSGVEALDKDGNGVYYEMRTLIDNTEFNPQIQSKAYCRLDIYLKQNSQIRGVIFLVRSSENCKLKFTIYHNEDALTSTTKNIEKDTTVDIDLIFENSIRANSQSEFYIEIEEIKDNENDELSEFKFDSLIIFLEE